VGDVAQVDPNSDPIRWVLPSVVTALAGFFGVLIGAWLTSRRERTQRRLHFIETQLREFYSPMLGMRSEIFALSDVRLHVERATEADLAGHTADYVMKSGKHGEQIEYNNRLLWDKLIPGYRKMVDLFRDNYWLTDSDTREFYPRLVEYVEIWNRDQAKALPVGVLKRLNYEESNLHPFYEHLRQKHETLRRQIEAGRPLLTTGPRAWFARARTKIRSLWKAPGSVLRRTDRLS
jgi:hypothetical protein